MGGSAANTDVAVPADRPPTPDPSPPLRGGRGEDGFNEGPQREFAPANYGTAATIPALDPELAKQLGFTTEEEDAAAMARPPRNKMEALGVAATAVALGQFITIGSVLTAIAAGGHAVLDAASTTWDGCVAAWPVVVSLGQTAAMLTATRTAAFVVLINLALAMGAFAGLTRLLAVTEEES